MTAPKTGSSTARPSQPVGTVAVEEAPEFIEYDKGTDRIYENIKSTDHLQVIDPENAQGRRDMGHRPHEVAPRASSSTKKAGRAYAAGTERQARRCSTWRRASCSRSVAIAPGTDGIAIDAKLGRVYCPGKGKMTVVSTVADDSVLGEVDLPAGAKNLAVDTATHTVWVNVSDGKGARLMSFKAPGLDRLRRPREDAAPPRLRLSELRANVIRPPRSATIWRQTESPMPAPPEAPVAVCRPSGRTGRISSPPGSGGNPRPLVPHREPRPRPRSSCNRMVTFGSRAGA